MKTGGLDDRKIGGQKNGERKKGMAGKMPAPLGWRRIVRVGMMADNSRLESVFGEGAEDDYEDS
jgi:hypothetical protein